MPNFHTHWLVALQALEGLPKEFKYLRDGRDTYVESAKGLGKSVRAHVSEVLKSGTLEGAAQLQETIKNKVEAWEKKVRDDDDAICFSAYMLGACGPDFWVLPVDTGGGMEPDLASHHFDLGHYNRTHLQFEVSLKALGRKDDLQARVEKAYFLGMATHIGADLVLHQLVNVSAGAYDLLKTGRIPPYGTWSNEQGSPDAPAAPQPEGRGLWQRARHALGAAVAGVVGPAAPIWTTHNKVEHYWDTWVRNRWLGDLGNRVLPEDVDLNPVFPPLGLPLCQTLREDLVGAVAGKAVAVGQGAKAEGPPPAVAAGKERAKVPDRGNAPAVAAGRKERANVRDGVKAVVGAVAGKVAAARPDAKPERPAPADRAVEERARVRDRVNALLGKLEVQWLLEKPLAFPWLFADAVLRVTCRPFIYDRVVDKEKGAYPGELVFAKARTEAESVQMNDPAPAIPAPRDRGAAPAAQGEGRSEKKKLQFFSTECNRYIPIHSWNYLNYVICPSLDRLKQYGKDVFYDRKAFPPFVAAGASAASAFANDLAHAYSSRKRRDLHKLGQFWNLDTGLGLRVEAVRSPERHQVITRIDWIHVLGPDGIAQAIDYAQPGQPVYVKEGMAKAPQPYAPIDAWREDARAFTVYAAAKRFRTLAAIEEDAAVVNGRKYLDRISIDKPVRAKPKAPVFARIAKKLSAPDDEFENALFSVDPPSGAAVTARIPTGKPIELFLQTVSHRLDLVIRASIARLGAGDGDVAMYLLGEKADNAVQLPADEDRVEEIAVDWLRKHSKILDKVVVPEASRTSDHSRLATFSARLIVNLSADKTKADARVLGPTQRDGHALHWNNVVPWEVHKGHYGRNFAVATARKFTLRGENSVAPFNFDPTKDFKCLEDLGLTEHCFFTLYPLVKLADGRWIDAFSKEQVTKAAFKNIKKLSAINFVKIVLLYVIDAGGALQLRWCYQDGVRRSVPEVPA